MDIGASLATVVLSVAGFGLAAVIVSGLFVMAIWGFVEFRHRP